MNKNLNIIIRVNGEMVQDNGEDSYSEYLLESKGYIGIYDGCGGSGSKRYDAAEGRTGAWLASRISAMLIYQWVQEHIQDEQRFMCGETGKEIQKYLSNNLNMVKKQLNEGNNSCIKGGLSLELPTTAAFFFYKCDAKMIHLKYMWAGDSRGYVLDRRGLAQVTKDDIDDSQDAYSNLQSDSKLENVIRADGEFYINQRELFMTEPCIAIVSSDQMVLLAIFPHRWNLSMNCWILLHDQLLLRSGKIFLIEPFCNTHPMIIPYLWGSLVFKTLRN